MTKSSRLLWCGRLQLPFKSLANHNKFSILHFLPPLIFWAIKFKIKETGRAKWQKKVKLKSCLPPLAQADTIYFSWFMKNKEVKRGHLYVVIITLDNGPVVPINNGISYPCALYPKNGKRIKLKWRLPPSSHLSRVKSKFKI